MRKLEPLKYVAGSTFIYLIMAACSATPKGSGGFMATIDAGIAAIDAAVFGDSASITDSSVIADGSKDTGGIVSPVPDAQADPTQGGTRLKANYYVGSDGSQLFAYFTDSGLSNAKCYFGTATDGTIRCIPEVTPAPVTAGSGIWFSDSGCSQPLAYSPKCGAAPTQAYLTITGTGTCPTSTTTVNAIGAVYTGTVYEGSPTSCVSTSVSTTYTLYNIGAVITPPDPSNWVQATIQTM